MSTKTIVICLFFLRLMKTTKDLYEFTDEGKTVCGLNRDLIWPKKKSEYCFLESQSNFQLC